ncbi:MAG: helix-turn-helix transcriptional regulator [Acetobacteraceae bacterium]|nr:helix-turn-helix transcriptional regulator [Acetobacteraceae bacterium]
MIQTEEQRRLLGAFLRTHRERVAPTPAIAAAGSPRRRTPGLRREEVAQLCGLSPTWYSWIEQGRDVSVSPAALARLADALHLSGAERAYLFDLARKRDPAAPAPEDADELPPALAQAVQAIDVPAYVLDRLWQARAWNDAALHLFAGWIGGAERNLLRYVFRDPTARQFIDDWDHRARRLVAEFRADTGRLPDDPALAALVAALQAQSPLFARFWQDQDVQEREGGLRGFNHPADGRLTFEQLTLRPASRPDCKLVMLLGPVAGE